MNISKTIEHGPLLALEEFLSNNDDVLTIEEILQLSEAAAERLCGELCCQPLNSGRAMMEDALATVTETEKGEKYRPRRSFSKAWNLLETTEDEVLSLKECPSFLVKRDATRLLWEAVDEAPVVQLLGAKGCGKSTFIRSEVTASLESSTRYQEVVIIDCFGMQSSSSRILEQDALNALLNGANLSSRSPTSFISDEPLLSYLEDRFNIGEACIPMRGLIVFDHVERLSLSSEVSKWLNRIINHFSNAGVSILLCSDDVDTRYSGSIRTIELSTLSASELDFWWSRDLFKHLRSAGVLSDKIFELTGGSPRLVRDFGRYIAMQKGKIDCPICWLDDFRERMTESFCPEVKEVADLVRHSPKFAQIQSSNPPKFGPIKGRLPVALRSNGQYLEFISPIFEERYKSVTSGSGWEPALRNGTDDQLTRLMLRRNVISDQLVANLIKDTHPAKVWKRIVGVFELFGVSSTRLFLRDPGNMKLWSLVHSANPLHNHRYWKVFPLNDQKYPDFALAASSGRVTQLIGSRIVIPFLRENGRVGAAISFKFKLSNADLFEERLTKRFLWNLALALQPAVALSAERALSKRSEREWRNSFYRIQAASLNRPSDRLSEILKQAGCYAAIILDHNVGGWDVSSAQTIEKGLEYSHWCNLLKSPNGGQLSAIHNHPSRKGLVLNGDDLKSVFPDWKFTNEVSAFFCPQMSGEHPLGRLVVFIFVGAKAHGIFSDQQMLLSMIANQANHIN